MNRTIVLSEITQLLNEILEKEDVVLEEATTAKDIDGWDSLNHAIFIAEVQKHFKVKFVLREVLNLKKVGNICDLVIERLENK
jgi:acyl carrier protein